MYLHDIFGLTAISSIYAGASFKEQATDLPIQREKHTHWPVIYGSSMKGALRSYFEATLGSAKENPCIQQLFGPDTENASEHAGALIISDAKLLLLPVRSLTSHVKWVTCPALLNRYLRDISRLSGKEQTSLKVPTVKQRSHVLVSQSANSQKYLYLEEYRYEAQNQDLNDWINELGQWMPDSVQSELPQNLAIVNNDQFNYLCSHAIPVNAHIAINNDTKTVDGGALWYQESLPSETQFYQIIATAKARDKSNKTAQDLMQSFKSILADMPYLQVGGNETTGMGWLEISLPGEQRSAGQ